MGETVNYQNRTLRREGHKVIDSKLQEEFNGNLNGRINNDSVNSSLHLSNILSSKAPLIIVVQRDIRRWMIGKRNNQNRVPMKVHSISAGQLLLFIDFVNET